MSRKEVPRAGLLKMGLAGQATNAQGAAALRVSPRHVQRLKGRFQAEGAPGLLHRGRGRPSTRRLASTITAQIDTLLPTRYKDFNDCHATEKLREVEGLRVSRELVRRRRRALGLPTKHRRRPRATPTPPDARGPDGAAGPDRRQPLCLARGPRPRHDLARRHR